MVDDCSSLKAVPEGDFVDANSLDPPVIDQPGHGRLRGSARGGRGMPAGNFDYTGSYKFLLPGRATS